MVSQWASRFCRLDLAGCCSVETMHDESLVSIVPGSVIKCFLAWKRSGNEAAHDKSYGSTQKQGLPTKTKFVLRNTMQNERVHIDPSGLTHGVISAVDPVVCTQRQPAFNLS